MFCFYRQHCRGYRKLNLINAVQSLQPYSKNLRGSMHPSSIVAVVIKVIVVVSASFENARS